ncbi:MAG: hypothetical protein H6756_02480 [Candidatus Omnitrophica bacterium]|nr:hypothetical protein [Candidatus Omnitrophota bacterium]
MKKALYLAITVIAICGIASNSYAAKFHKNLGVVYQDIEGTVEKLIPGQGALIIKDKDDGEKTHIHIDKSTLSALELGDTIKVRMQGSNCIVQRVIVK